MTIQPRRLNHIYDHGRAFTAAKRTCEEFSFMSKNPRADLAGTAK